MLGQQFENLHRSLQGLGDRLTTGMSDGFDKQTAASDRLGNRVSGSLNDMKDSVTDLKDSMKGSMAALTDKFDQFMQLFLSQHVTSAPVTGVTHSPLGDSAVSKDSVKETETVENKEPKSTATTSSSVQMPPTDISASTVQAPSTVTSISSVQITQFQSTAAPAVNVQTGTVSQTVHTNIQTQNHASVQPSAVNTSVTTTTVATLTPQVSSLVAPNTHGNVQVPTASQQCSQSVPNTGQSSVYAPAALQQSMPFSTPMAQGNQPLQGLMPMYNPSVPPPLLGFHGGRYGPGPERLRDYDFQQELDHNPGLDFAESRQRSARGRARTREWLKPSISNVKVPEFDGIKPWRNFITRFERLCEAFGLEGDVRLEWLLLSLTDRASAFVATCLVMFRPTMTCCCMV